MRICGQVADFLLGNEPAEGLDALNPGQEVKIKHRDAEEFVDGKYHGVRMVAAGASGYYLHLFEREGADLDFVGLSGGGEVSVEEKPDRVYIEYHGHQIVPKIMYPEIER